MVSYNKTKKEITIKTYSDVKELFKTLNKDAIMLDDMTGSIKITCKTLVLENNSCLCIEESNITFAVEHIIFKDESSFSIGCDKRSQSGTKVTFKGLNKITLGNKNIITFKNSVISSDTSWLLKGKDGLLNIIKSYVDFYIDTDFNTIIKDIELTTLLSNDRNMVIHDVDVPWTGYEAQKYLTTPNADMTFYNGTFNGYEKLLDSSKLTKPTRLIFKGSNLKCGYEFDKNENVEIIHEFLLSGRVYDNNGNPYLNNELEIIDRFKHVIDTIVTDENGCFSIWLPYYTYLNNQSKFHMPCYIMSNDSKISISIAENKNDLVLHINKNIDKELLLLIERVDNKILNGFSEVKTGIANLMFNSEKPIKNVSPTSVVTTSGTKLTIN